jgi:hypothetical protein
MRIVSRIDVEISYFGEVDVHALQLEVGSTVVPAQKYQTAILENQKVV